MIKVTPFGNNVIFRVIPNEEKIGMFIIPDSAKETSTLAEVMVESEFSYHPDGTLKDTVLKRGMIVRLPKGNVGTEMPEAPEGETWICAPEDLPYYKVEEIDHE